MSINPSDDINKDEPEKAKEIQSLENVSGEVSELTQERNLVNKFRFLSANSNVCCTESGSLIFKFKGTEFELKAELTLGGGNSILYQIADELAHGLYSRSTMVTKCEKGKTRIMSHDDFSKNGYSSQVARPAMIVDWQSNFLLDTECKVLSDLQKQNSEFKPIGLVAAYELGVTKGIHSAYNKLGLYENEEVLSKLNNYFLFHANIFLDVNMPELETTDRPEQYIIEQRSNASSAVEVLNYEIAENSTKNRSENTAVIMARLYRDLDLPEGLSVVSNNIIKLIDYLAQQVLTAKFV